MNRTFGLPVRPASRHSVKTATRAGVNVSILLDTLKREILDQELANVEDMQLRQLVKRAGDEAAALAWTTPFPLLALPELLVEKSRQARVQFQRQRHIEERTKYNTSLAA